MGMSHRTSLRSGQRRFVLRFTPRPPALISQPPEVMRRKGGALLPQFQENPRVMLRGHFVLEKRSHARAGDEWLETRLNGRLPVPGGESGPQSSTHNQRKIMPARLTHKVDSTRYAAQKVTQGFVSSGTFVDFETSASTRSNARIAASRAGSSRYVPIRESKS